MLTAERLRELLRYDPETGVFVWIKRTSNRIRIGESPRRIGRDGYVRIFIDGRSYLAHRLAWLYVTGEWPSMFIDHVNGQRSDNKYCNLRDVSGAVNNQNQRKAQARNQSGFLNVYFHKSSGLYTPRLTVDGKEVSMGYFKDPEEAHRVALAAKRRLHEGCTI